MSGYFARLAAQIGGPSAPGAAAAVQAPASLEQHVEVVASSETPRVEPAEDAAPSPGGQPASAMPQEAPRLRGPHAPKPTTAAAARQGGPVPPMPPMPRRGVDATEPASRPFTPANGEAKPAGPPARRPAPAAVAAESAVPADQADAAPLEARTAAAPPSPFAAKAGDPARPALPNPGFSASTARAGTVDHVRPAPLHPPTGPSNGTAPTPRHDVRIGSITLEVRPPAAPAVPAQPPQPAPTPAPRQVALRRHYLRWS